MRWLAVWLLLTVVYLAGRLALPLLAGARWGFTREDLAHLALVPIVQAAALWVVALVRRQSRRTAVTSPPPAPETPARRPAAEP